MSNFSTFGINEPLSGFTLNDSALISSSVGEISGDVNLQVSAIIISDISLSIDVESNLDASGFSIVFAESDMSGLLDINVSMPIMVIIADVDNISISSQLSISDAIVFTPNARYPGSYVPLLLLDGLPITAQNRKFADSLKAVFVEQKNWNNDKSRYYKRSDAGKKVFKLTWEWLPSERQFTIDNREARNFIKKKATDPDVHTLTLLSYGEDPEDIFEEINYNVFITNYSENLVRRDLSTGTYFWNCDLELEEV